MTDKLFNKIWHDALVQPSEDMFIGEYGYPDWFDEISTDAEEVVAKLQQIHRVAHMSVRDMLKLTGLTQAAFACKFCVPLRTVEDWSRNVRKCPDSVRLLIAYRLGMID